MLLSPRGTGGDADDRDVAGVLGHPFLFLPAMSENISGFGAEPQYNQISPSNILVFSSSIKEAALKDTELLL